MRHFYQHIEGWFDFEQVYRDAVRDCPDGGKIVEMGSYVGKSSAFMAVEIINSGKKIDFYCVDTWRMEDVPGVSGEGCTLGRFIDNVRPVLHVVHPINLTSTQASWAFPVHSLDFVFIDGDHSYQSVCDDIFAWQSRVKPGGVLAGHDYTDNWPGVQAAVNECLIGAVGNGTCWVKKKPETR